VHPVVSVELQVRVVVAPDVTVVGLAVSVTVGAEPDKTSTVTLFEVEPPGPLQLSVKAVASVSGLVTALPLVGSAPLQPPLAVQLVALVDDH